MTIHDGKSLKIKILLFAQQCAYIILFRALCKISIHNSTLILVFSLQLEFIILIFYKVYNTQTIRFVFRMMDHGT